MAAVVTDHIAKLFDEAARIAREELNGVDASSHMAREARISWIEKCLDRIDNLCKHAQEELQDEYLRARDGWPAV